MVATLQPLIFSKETLVWVETFNSERTTHELRLQSTNTQSSTPFHHADHSLDIAAVKLHGSQRGAVLPWR
jgi:hypothetical protein